MTNNIEIVLPSGKFARVRPILTIDFLLAASAEHMIAALVASNTLIDDEYVTYQEVLEMPLEDAMPLLDLINLKLKLANKTVKGVI